MSDDTTQSELEALERKLTEVKAQYEAAQTERARLKKEREQLQKENDELTEAAFRAAQHGDLFIASYGDAIRKACEGSDVDAEMLIEKVRPLTLEFFLGEHGQFVERMADGLTDEEMVACQRANEIALKSLWDVFKRRSSKA